MKPQIYIMPYGSCTKLAKLIHISADTIRKVCHGQIKGVCSEETAKLIYDNAPKVGGFRPRYIKVKP